MTKKRWLSLWVENEIGVLARISGLFSGKAYNLDSLTVGMTEDETISRMTIGLTSDDRTLEQIKKQLNRSVEVIRVTDFTDKPVYRKELMFVRICDCSESDKEELRQLCKERCLNRTEESDTGVVLESVQTEAKNDDLICLLKKNYGNRMEIVRGGSVAVEGIGMSLKNNELED